MKKINLKKGNKKFALFSMLFLLLSCSNKTENNPRNTNNTPNVEQQKNISQEDLQ